MKLAYQYTNRRSEVYYLQAKERGGKFAYSATRKPKGKVLDRLPDGYEIYEKPEDAQVYVRRIKPSPISANELQLVEAAIRQLAKLELFIVEINANNLIIHLTDFDPDASLKALSTIMPMTPVNAQAPRNFLLRSAPYTKMMRFVLTDQAARLFSAERWFFLGGIDDWYPLAWNQPLAELVETYVPHLGRDSFFELM